jgi:hypothetical protein
MFDDVRCELPLPGPIKPKRLSFQTKDLDCALDLFTIKADGTLMRSGGCTDDSEYAYPFHGMLTFYTYEGGGRKEDGDGMWFEYEAKFTDGKCVGLECVQIARQPWGQPRVVLFPESTAQGELDGRS